MIVYIALLVLCILVNEKYRERKKGRRCAFCGARESAHVTTSGDRGVMCPPPATYGTFRR